jgi:hypothetical protein
VRLDAHTIPYRPQLPTHASVGFAEFPAWNTNNLKHVLLCTPLTNHGNPTRIMRGWALDRGMIIVLSL